MFSIKSLLGRTPEIERAETLYSETILAARSPVFFTDWGVPDTPEGRFEVLALTAFLLLHRMKEVAGAETLSQAYFDVMFDDLDSNLRELGVGELSVGKRVKKLAAGFYGRIKAYEDGLIEEANDVLMEALSRNLYAGDAPANETTAKVADFLRESVGHLASQNAEELIAGKVSFLSPVSEAKQDD